MTADELTWMQRTLEVQLPPDYCAAMLRFPLPEFVGTGDCSLFDLAALNVERTLEYRAGYGGASPWSPEYVHIGDDDDACPYAMRCPDGYIVKTDHGSLDVPPLATYAGVREFVAQLVRDFTSST